MTSRVNLLFVLTVLLPTIGAILYYGLIASNVYISESRFVVRNTQKVAPTGGISSLLLGTGLSHAQDDSYVVHDFILSRDALRELDKKLNVRKAFTAHDVSVVDRFAGIDWDDSFEALYNYYQKHVGVDFDTASSISVLTVRAFTAEDARKINEALLAMSERLVNELNIRSQQDLLKVAHHEVDLAEAKAKDAALALSKFRAKHGVYDPDSQSALQLQTVAKLQEQLLSTQAQLTQLREMAPRNPQVAALSGQERQLRRAIADQTTRVLGSASSFAANVPTYNRLVLDNTFADRELTSALGSLESARVDAQNKQAYLDRIVEPGLPDKAMEPKRIRSVLTVLVLGLIVWGVLSLVVSSILEHAD